MFYSYYFNTGPLSKKRFETRFRTGASKNPVTGEEERWLGMSFNSMFDGKGIKTHGRPNLNVVIGTWLVKSPLRVELCDNLDKSIIKIIIPLS